MLDTTKNQIHQGPVFLFGPAPCPYHLNGTNPKPGTLPGGRSCLGPRAGYVEENAPRCPPAAIPFCEGI